MDFLPDQGSGNADYYHGDSEEPYSMPPIQFDFEEFVHFDPHAVNLAIPPINEATWDVDMTDYMPTASSEQASMETGVGN